jgi:hypothetical protein
MFLISTIVDDLFCWVEEVRYCRRCLVWTNVDARSVMIGAMVRCAFGEIKILDSRIQADECRGSDTDDRQDCLCQELRIPRCARIACEVVEAKRVKVHIDGGHRYARIMIQPVAANHDLSHSK